MSLFEDRAVIIICEDGKCGTCWMCEIDKEKTNE
jgi:hypothetical protein